MSPRLLVCFTVAICGLACLHDHLIAQDFRVYTTVEDLTGPKRSRPQHSITLFHAGKVYDYIDAAEETVIYEPSHSRFLILNKRHNLATEITHDEIRRFLDLADKHAREILLAGERGDQSSQTDFELLEFQLLPEFVLHEETKANKLTFTSPLVSYTVTYADPPSPEHAQAYLKSADWTAQLNAVMHPAALLPQARLRVNEELRKRRVIPREVELMIEGEHPIHRRAKHEWTWNLTDFDRKLIDHRESLLRQPNFRTMPFTDFQREMLTSAVKR